MYCIKCGNELNDGIAFCPKCGAPQQETAAPAAEQQAEPIQSAAYTYSAPATQEPPYNGLCIAGLIVSCVSMFLNFFGLVSVGGIIVSALGIADAKKKGEKGKAMGIIGIVVGVLVILLTIAVTVFAFLLPYWAYSYY